MKLSKFSVGVLLEFKYPEIKAIPDAQNHQTQDWHPALIVGTPHHLGRPRFRDALYQIVPTTSFKPDYKRWSSNQRLYPLIAAREGGFKKDSLILLDQLMTVDLNYYFLKDPPHVEFMGFLKQAEMRIVMSGVKAYFDAQDYSSLE